VLDQENIQDLDLNEEMRASFLEYAYSVIYARALPDARDGLKPVQRRILYQMSQMNLYPERPYVKSARVVGDVMGKLHPHGDSAIYEAMVRLAQDFSLRLPLVDGHGNFGSLDDGPAASRYTEARMTGASLLMCESLDEDVVDFVPNYDNKLFQPDVLPSAIPNLLVNGSTGIAVGMATNMPPHNLQEVISGAVYLIKNPDSTLEDLMKYIPGPDLPTGGKIIGLEPIREAYANGRGIFKIRAKTGIEKVGKKQAIIVSELPYMVGPEKVLDSISKAVKDGKIEGISAAVDLTDRQNGLRIQIEIKNGFNPQAILTRLYKLTPLESSFGVNNVALVEGAPKTLGLKEMLQVWCNHRFDVVRRRTEHRLKAREDRLHLINGLLLAIVDIDDVIQVIRTSEDTAEASSRLQKAFDLDEIQANYILDLRLRRLTKFSRIELETEKSKLEEEIADLKDILNRPKRLQEVVCSEMYEVARNFATPRRTVLIDSDGVETQVDASGAISSQSLIMPISKDAKKLGNSNVDLEVPDTPCYVLLSATGMVARVIRGNKETAPRPPLAQSRSPHDAISASVLTTTRSNFGVLTSYGRVFALSPLELPEITRGENVVLDKLDKNTQGIPRLDKLEISGLSGAMPLNSLLTLEGTETPVSIIPLYDEESVKDAKPLAIGTTLGVVKRVKPEPVPHDRSGTAHTIWSEINLQEGDSVLGAGIADDDADVVFIASDSSLLRFNAGKFVRPQGRNAGGMAGISLKSGQQAVFFGVLSQEDLQSETPPLVFTVAGEDGALPGTQNGHAKLTPYLEYPDKGRGTGGVRSQAFLKGQNALIYAWAGRGDARANTASGTPADLPEIDLRRSGSGKLLDSPITCIG
jgi:DNA gyrase subunit A